MTDPLVPAEVDLRDFPYMPVQLARLRASKEWLLAKKDPALGFYAFNLWAAAWHERPAGSLEDDDDVLADRAICTPARWKVVKEKVLRKWVKCSDGRLYHPIVAEVVLESWAAKLANRQRTNAATEARRLRDVARNAERDANATNDVTNDVTLPPRSPREVKRSGSEGILNRDSVVTPDIPSEAPHADATGHGAVENIAKSKAKVNGVGQDWGSPAWVAGTATTLGMTRRQGEDDTDFRDRIYTALQQRVTSAKQAHA